MLGLDTGTAPITATADGVTLEPVGVDPLVEESRRRPFSRLQGTAAFTSVALAASYLAAAVALPILTGVPLRSALTGTALFFVACYAVVSRIEFEIGTGASVPTVVVLVPMLFVLPPQIGPLLVAVAYTAAAVVDIARGQLRPHRLPVLLSTCWHAMGPAVVLALWATRQPRWSDLPIYAVALLAQFGFDTVSSVIRERAFGVAPGTVMRFLSAVFLVDALLAPVALTGTFEVYRRPAALVAMLPLTALLWMFARERQSRIEQAVALSRAYAGARDTALHDELTGLLNRRGWDEAFEARLSIAGDRDEVTSLVVLDVDGLKHANDTFGHETGDALIQAVARSLTGAVRGEDVVARLGGDEFGVILPAASALDCEGVVSRIRRTLTRQRVPGVAVSASIGAATCRPGDDLRLALRLADERMYEAKASSRPHGRLAGDRRTGR
jgi:diguanylate cyclase (GGDEF)-like protein